MAYAMLVSTHRKHKLSDPDAVQAAHSLLVQVPQVLVVLHVQHLWQPLLWQAAEQHVHCNVCQLELEHRRVGLRHSEDLSHVWQRAQVCAERCEEVLSRAVLWGNQQPAGAKQRGIDVGQSVCGSLQTALLAPARRVPL
jgi:hypothetical protein